MLLNALAAHALTELASRLNNAGLDRATVTEGIERLARAVVAVGDRYAVLAGEHCSPDEADAERLVGAPMRAVFERGIASGLLRPDLTADVLLELFAGTIMAAIKLTPTPATRRRRSKRRRSRRVPRRRATAIAASAKRDPQRLSLERLMTL